MLAESVWLLTLLCLAALSAVFIYVIATSQSEKPYQEVQAKWYSFRSKWIRFLFGFGVFVALATLIPFPVSNQKGVEDATVVNVVGHQWYWLIDKTEFELGETVEFHVTSADANHGFGIYDENDHMLTQTQAMPDYVNKVVHTFDKPGNYRILCMEYCGLAHHAMMAQLTVK